MHQKNLNGGFTTGAIHDYLDPLTGEGRLNVVGHNDAEILRLLSISLIALNARGIPQVEAMKQIYILGSDEYPVFVMKKTPFKQQEIFEPAPARRENNRLCAGNSVDTRYRRQFGIH